MREQNSNDGNSPVRPIKKLTLPDGFRVGIVNLDYILKEVASLKLTEAKTIKAELIRRVKADNYVPFDAENDYAAALYHDYLEKYGGSKSDSENKAGKHKHTPG